MKSSKIYFAIYLTGFFLLVSSLTAQDVFAYKFIGKPRTDVVQKYGKPVHMDNTDPSMVCMFYKSNQDQMVFVSDQNSVYQVEVTKSFSSKASAINQLEELLAEAVKENYKTDTLSVSEFKLDNNDAGFTAILMHNDNLSKYEVRVKASRK